MDTRELWTVGQVAHYHDVTLGTVYTWVKTDLLEAVVYPSPGAGNPTLFDPEVVRAFSPPPRGPRRPFVRKIDADPKVLAARWEAGESLESIAGEFGVTRERVRQLIFEYDPTLRDRVRERKQAKAHAKEMRRLNAQLQANARHAIRYDLKCVVCGCWVLKTTSATEGNLTCGPEHSKAWPVIRYFEEHGGGYDRHREMIARSILNRPDAPEHRKEHARAVLRGEMPPNRRFFVPGSYRSELIRKYRPEAYKRIVEGN